MVIVPDPANVIATRLNVAGPVKVKLPWTVVGPADWLHVPLTVDHVKSWQTAVASVVTVCPERPELLSKNTSSTEVGALAPPEPPEVADQCVVVVESHVPAPPTQKRLATAYLASQAIRMIALLASAAGKTIVKSPADEDLSLPKSRTATALFDSDEL